MQLRSWQDQMPHYATAVGAEPAAPESTLWQDLLVGTIASYIANWVYDVMTNPVVLKGKPRRS